MNVKSYRSLTSSDIKVEKGLGAVILFILTFVLTLIPYKLKSIQEINLRTVKCFCGGVSWILFFKFHTSKNLRASILFWETQRAFLKIYNCILKSNKWTISGCGISYFPLFLPRLAVFSQLTFACAKSTVKH